MQPLYSLNIYIIKKISYWFGTWRVPCFQNTTLEIYFITGTSPNVTAARLIYNAEIGDNVTLDVLIYSPDSALLTIDWFFHQNGFDQKLNVSASAKYIGSTLERPSLLIINIRTDDMGNYSCVAKNSYGKGESELMLLEIKGIFWR